MPRVTRGRDRLTPKQVLALIRKLQRTGDRDALERIVRAHRALVYKVARQYRWSQHELDDLVQVGCLGLLRALERFDPERGVMLASYALPWIRSMIVHYVLDNWRLVRIGTTEGQRKAFFGARRAGGPPTDDEALVQHLTVPEMSLDAPLPGEIEGTRVERLRAPEGTRPDVQIENRNARAHFRAAVARFAAGLPARERRVFEARWLVQDPRTLASLGVQLGVSKERTRQLEERILERLGRFLEREVADLQTLVPALAA